MVSLMTHIMFIIIFTETPHINFTLDNNIQLSCSAHGGYPFYHNITLIKNAVAVASNITPLLVYTISDGCNKYGLYQCLVDTIIQSIIKEIIVEEEGVTHILYN